MSHATPWRNPRLVAIAGGVDVQGKDPDITEANVTTSGPGS